MNFTCDNGQLRAGGDRDVAIFDVDDVLSRGHRSIAE